MHEKELHQWLLKSMLGMHFLAKEVHEPQAA